MQTRKRKKRHIPGICKLRELVCDTRGTTALMFALSLPAVMAVVGVATDFGLYSMKRSKMQSAADQAAIAGAKELTLSQFSDKSVLAAADGTVRAYLGDPKAVIDVKASIEDSNKKVRVEVTETWTPIFAHIFGADITPIKTYASAALFGESKICVLALTPSEFGAIAMTKNSHLRADGCTVYSNSSSSSSMYMGDTSSVEAKLVCAVGGVKDNGSLTADKVVTDCPVLNDPLASRQPPSIGSCDQTNLDVSSGNHVLSPGVYCGGLKVGGTASVQLKPGDYIIKDGPLLVNDDASFSGDDVGFFFTGTMGLLHLRGSAKINLNGREDGPMAGMLFFDDPKAKGLLRIHSISASKARNLTGTIYFPNGNLIVDPTASVGEESAYTAIVAKRLVVQNGPTLVLNTNYNETSVPVPEGIRAASDVHLVE